MATTTRFPLEHNPNFASCPLLFWAPNTRTITAIEIQHHGDFVNIVPVGVRGVTLLGGFRMYTEDLRNFCKQFKEFDSERQEA